MIQLIFEYTDKDVLEEVYSELKYPLIDIPEMLDDMYLTLLPANEVGDLEDLLKQPPLKMEVVGTYNLDGTQYVWTEPGETKWNHSINKYKNKLRGEYTEEEAANRQVNKIAGYPDRILE